jgi:hypothetical protein
LIFLIPQGSNIPSSSSVGCSLRRFRVTISWAAKKMAG